MDISAKEPEEDIEESARKRSKGAPEEKERLTIPEDGAQEEQEDEKMEEGVEEALMRIRVDVAEIYSPPRATARASQFGLTPGFALDLSVNDPDDGMPWDFDEKAKRDKARRLLQEQRPQFIIGSPASTAFSAYGSGRALRGDALCGDGARPHAACACSSPRASRRSAGA